MTTANPGDVGNAAPTFFSPARPMAGHHPIEMIYRDADDKALFEGLVPELETRQSLTHVFAGPGMALSVAHFGPGFLLPLHAHSGDCLYYIEAGSISMGNRTLTAGEGFFVPDGLPYAYRAGPDGVRLLEFRHEPIADFTLLERNLTRWRDRFRASVNAVATECAEPS